MVICCCNSISSGLLQAEVDCERMCYVADRKIGGQFAGNRRVESKQLR